MVTLPLWAVFAVSFGSPALAFTSVLVAQWIGRRTARELETRSRREETMRTLRWAAELAIDDDSSKARLGTSQLAALGRSPLLDGEQSLFVDAAFEVLVDPVDDALDSDPSGRRTTRSRGPALESVEDVVREDPDDG